MSFSEALQPMPKTHTMSVVRNFITAIMNTVEPNIQWQRTHICTQMRIIIPAGNMWSSRVLVVCEKV